MYVCGVCAYLSTITYILKILLFIPPSNFSVFTFVASDWHCGVFGTVRAVNEERSAECFVRCTVVNA